MPVANCKDASHAATDIAHQPRDMAATDPPTRRDELAAFVFFAVFMAPLLAVTIVGAYGFAVWMAQLIAGPPTG
jgi:nitrate reductase NapE